VNGQPQQTAAEPAAAPKLCIFPHAGGSAKFYVPFARAFSADIQRIAVQYPGKQRGAELSLITSIPDLADDICQMLKPSDHVGTPVVFFGHSMGALVAFEVALRFQAAGTPVAALFVSACAAPGHMGYEYLQGSDDDLLKAVADATGAKAEFLADEKFAATLLPTLRGVRAVARYSCAPDATLTSPIHAFLASDDPIATYDKVLPWSERTTSEFSVRVFDGGHFYLNDNLPELVGDVESRIEQLR
jgi:surfactin synthase thioesterase subunit